MPKESTKTTINYTPDFEAIWLIWPKRDGKKSGKFAAFKIWRDLDIKLRRQIYAVVRDRQGRWGEKPKDLSTWLNQRGWEDDYEIPRVGSDTSKINIGPKSIDILVDQATKLLNTFCKHQVLKPWTYKGNHTSVTIPGCAECRREEQTLYSTSHAETSLETLKESTGAANR